MRVFCVLFVLAFVFCVRAQVAPVCTRQLFESTTNFSTQSMVLLYSQRGTRCNSPNQGNAQLDCGTSSTATYTTYSFAAATSGFQQPTSGLCARFNISQVAPAAVGCHQYENAPADQPVSTIRPVYVGAAITRAFISYPLQQARALTLPFTWAQFSSTNTSSCPVLDPNATCSGATLQQPAGFVRDGNNCDATYIRSVWGDTAQSADVYDHCGGFFSDPITQILPVSDGSCASACCATCGTNQSASYRRWPVGPRCQVFSIGPPTLLAYGAVQVSNNADLSAGETILFQQRVTGSDGSASFNGGLTSSRDYISTQRKARVHVNAVRLGLSDLRQIPGYAVVCSLVDSGQVPVGSKSNVCDQGAGNPYITDKGPPPCLQQFGNGSLADQVPPVALFPPSSEDTGIGRVPTQTSLQNASCSFFFVPFASPAVGVLDPAQFAKPIKDQVSNMWTGLDGPDTTTGGTTCPGAGSMFFPNYTNVPGWQPNASTGEPLVTSVCQMAAALNNYSATFLQIFNSMIIPDVEEAKRLTGPPPPFLMPQYDIGAPNWWLHDGSLMFDAGQTFPQQQGFELLLQLADDRWLQQEENMQDYALNQGSQCYVRLVNGTGLVQPVVDSLTSSIPGDPSTGSLQIACTTHFGAQVVLSLPATPNVPLANQSVPLNITPGTTGVVGPIIMNYTRAKNVTVSPYISCTMQLVDAMNRTYGPVLTRGCIRVDSIGDVVELANAPQDDDDDLNLAIVGSVVGVVFVLAVVALVAVILYLRYRNTEKAERAHQT